MKPRTVLLLVAITFLLIFKFTCFADAFSYRIVNDSDEKMYYRLTWNECDWEGFPSSIAIAAGEIAAGEEHSSISSKYKGGDWTMEWESKKTGTTVSLMDVPDHGILILNALKSNTFLPGI